jgi:hypothetical protein
MPWQRTSVIWISAWWWAFAAGSQRFFGSFRAYGKSRFLQDTPATPIRGVAMGFVRIHGKAKSDQLVTSPITHTSDFQGGKGVRY